MGTEGRKWLDILDSLKLNDDSDSKRSWHMPTILVGLAVPSLTCEFVKLTSSQDEWCLMREIWGIWKEP
jgi:hypothetical protein